MIENVLEAAIKASRAGQVPGARPTVVASVLD
jgi:hypothetical protein